MRESLGKSRGEWCESDRRVITTFIILIPVNTYSYSLSDDMGLYRARLVRFFLGTVVVIAIIQILTTLHFSSIHGNEATSLIQARETRTKRNQPESTTSQVDQGQGKTAVNVQREAQTRVIRNRVSRRISSRFSFS